MTNQSTCTDTKCYHCSDVCTNKDIFIKEKYFCCVGCQTVYEILQSNDLCSYYDIDDKAGVSLKGKDYKDKYAFLDEDNILKELLDYQDDNIAKVRLYIPSIHCSSCVWLLENLESLKDGVVVSRLNFVKKELSLTYSPKDVSLRTIVELLSTLGYAPAINLDTPSQQTTKSTVNRSLLKKIGLTGFCMGNIMLMSFPDYLHLDINSVDQQYKFFFVWLNFLLALPVYFYSASDYLKGAILSISENFKRHTNELSVDIPIALGITALFIRSVVDNIMGNVGYWDSMAGLVFFLLVGKWLQEVTFNYLSFERNYKSYFPLAVTLKKGTKETYVPITSLKKDQSIIIHHQELIPADGILISEKAHIDYSFVTGEADPITINKGEFVFAGGRQMGGKIELLVEKPISQSYMTQLWNNDAFEKDRSTRASKIAASFSKYFTYITLIVAVLVAVYWAFVDSSVVWFATTAVLMVACPCALTLSMPFTMGAVMAIFGKHKFYVKNQSVIQHLSEVDTIVFDKTGTLTETNSSKVSYHGEELSKEETRLIKTVVAQSNHPLSRKIRQFIVVDEFDIAYVEEVKGQGVEGEVKGRFIKIGRVGFVGASKEYLVPNATTVHISIDGKYMGYYHFEQQYRKGIKETLDQLSDYKLELLSGDNDTESKRLSNLFGNHQHYEQTPQGKLDFVNNLQEKGQRVMMMGDGINDAGALQQSDVGIALAEDAHTFSPASDAILEADAFEKLPQYINFSKKAIKTVKLSFLLSLVYNFFGITWAATGTLSPVICAIFMPISSISVVAFSVLMTYIYSKNLN